MDYYIKIGDNNFLASYNLYFYQSYSKQYALKFKSKTYGKEFAMISKNSILQLENKQFTVTNL